MSIEDLCTLILSFIYGYLTKQYPVPFLIDLRFSFRIVDWSAIKHVKKLKLIYEARQLFKTALHALKKRENGKAFLPLVANSVFMEIALNEFEIARNLCQSFLIQIPNLPELWGLYALVEKVKFDLYFCEM